VSVTVLAGVLSGLAVLVAAPRPRLQVAGVRGAIRAAGPPSRRRAERRAARTAPDLLVVLDMVAAQVRAGAEPGAAWAAAVEVSRADLPGHDPVEALQSLSSSEVASGAAAAAAAWRLARRTGAPLADLLGSVCASVRADREDHAFLEAAVAGPRATVRLLLALPLAGVGLGQLVGARPLHVLFGTGAGRVCGGAGALLLVIGLVWMHALVSSVETAGRPERRGGRS
jgi:tight adherence protein B